MELHAIHNHVLDAANKTGAVGLGQTTGYSELFQTTWLKTETEVTKVNHMTYVNIKGCFQLKQHQLSGIGQTAEGQLLLHS